MSKRGSKLQEFVAHASSNVNCLSIGKKSRRVFVTGGDDRKVNLWAVGRTTPLLCLSGHTSPVKSVTYDSEEVLVVAGASSGTIKLWDLEQSKNVRTLTGHRAKCSSVEFHPFGEFFASGSSDTDLKIWDIRKKACIHTYNGHSRGITTIRFSPDGRWVVSCGEDNVVKVWDLTAGRLLHDFKSHGVVQCIDFHPHEFLMATGSADRVVQFWDLETFELIVSSGSEASGVHSVSFHPDGRTLFCGLDESLKVFSWEPIRCHDAVVMGWSHLGDLCIHEGQLLGCSYHQSRVAIWIADISLIGPYASGIIPRSNNNMDPESNNGENPPVVHLGTGMTCNMTSLSVATLHKRKTEEITKNPHLTSSKSTRSVPLRDDSVHRVSPANSVGFQMSKSIEDGHCNGQGVKLSLSAKFQRSGSLTSKDHLVNGHIRCNRQAINRPVAGPAVVSKDSLESRNTSSYKNEAANAKIVAPVTPPKSTHMRKLSLTNGGTGVQTVGTKSELLNSTTNSLDVGLRPNFLSRSMVNTETIESAEGHHASIKNAAEKIERIQSTDHPLSFRHENYLKPAISVADVKPTLSSEQPGPVQYVKGVAVVQGRTRSLVESWERRERCKSSEAVAFSSPNNTILESVNMPSTVRGCLQTSERNGTDSEHGIEIVMQNHESFLSVLNSRFTKLQVVRRFWEQSGVKGAITAVENLPDHAVQVDLISILMEKIDTISLDVFTCLLPLLRGLLDSNIERHINVSLEMLLKLVKIFGPVISSTTSASSVVGVDLQAERRRALCNQCFSQLQNIKKILQSLIRRGGSLERLGLELNLVLQGL